MNRPPTRKWPVLVINYHGASVNNVAAARNALAKVGFFEDPWGGGRGYKYLEPFAERRIKLKLQS